MCGIAGAFYYQQTQKEISTIVINAINQLSKRGPDSNGYVFLTCPPCFLIFYKELKYSLLRLF
jgi:asparagine synthetase B (glutamine-hydrolysing)